MPNPVLVKTFTASGAIGAYRAVTSAGDHADGIVVQAAVDPAPLLGVTAEVDAGDDEPIGVVLHGIAFLQLGDTVVFGERLTVDSDGRGVPCVLAPGTAEEVIGTALAGGHVGEIIDVLVQPMQLTTPV
jgi:hypothetical protein